MSFTSSISRRLPAFLAAALVPTVFGQEAATVTASTNGDFLLSNPAYNNTRETPLIGGVSYAQNLGLNPRPQDGSPALGNVYTQGTGLTTATYRGAFAPDGNWADSCPAISRMQFMTLGPAAAEPVVLAVDSGTTPNTIKISVPAAAGKAYVLQYKPSVGEGSPAWSPTGIGGTAEGGTIVFDDVPTDQPARFFQVDEVDVP